MSVLRVYMCIPAVLTRVSDELGKEELRSTLEDMKRDTTSSPSSYLGLEAKVKVKEKHKAAGNF